MIATAPNATHEKCFPRLANRAVSAEVAKVVPITLSRLDLDVSPRYNNISRTPMPNQAIEVKCHAKRSVCLVK